MTKETIIIRSLSNECSQEEQELLLNWISQSEENKKEYAEIEMLYNSKRLEEYSDKSFLQSQKLKLYERIENYSQEENQKNKFLSLRFWQYAVASIVVILLLVGGIFYNNLARPQMIVVENNEQNAKEILLSDGTTVWLNKSSVFKYPQKFNDNNRKVILEGEAYFKVSKDKSCPFIVHSESMDIKVLGTTFNLHTRKEANISFVTLVEGEVQVKGNNNEGQVVLKPSQRAEINKKENKLYVHQIPTPALDAVWHNKLIPFDNATVSDIAKSLEYVYGINVYVDSIDNEVTYSGVLKSQENIEEVLIDLEKSIPISYKIEQENVYITYKK